MNLCILGLGYIGLPTALMFSKSGIHVHGVDINQDLINKLTNNQIELKEPGLNELLTEVITDGTITFSTSPKEADAFIIAVPTPITSNKKANLKYIAMAAEMILPYLRKGNLVVLESTVPPKTTEHMLIPILQKRGFIIGEDLFISHAPERVYPGKLLKELVDNNRIIGGYNDVSSLLTVDLYKKFVKGNFYITDLTTAEMVKLIENSYRDVNIAFANELARAAESVGFNVWEAIELANSHPRVHVHYPGPGVGGHCIAVDPWFIIEKAPRSRMLKMARLTNDFTPVHMAEMIEKIIKDISCPVITLLGLAYKENVDDLRESPTLTVIDELNKRGCQLKIYDPLVSQRMDGKVDTLEQAVSGSDCIVVLTGHQVFKDIDFNQIKDLLRTRMIFDTRNIWNKDVLQELGFSYYSIGMPLRRANGDEAM